MKQTAIRRKDGRIIEWADTYEEGCQLARQHDAAAYIEPEDSGSVALASVVPLPDVGILTEALEYILSLDPEECERVYLAELREALRRKYPGGD